ncbi:uncharacterized protein MYCFIDRAFT_200605 [Pseudocercospora fijiensis CIRAD86]|uniref:Cell wall galactomannoprotein n=1 Tax=Pseudocercospora fijiensis (strain CIRAD86) TaxID=383855 RepID=M2ZYU4_PSEFD|nr:uncharacterized protein MYCFIDRAFT_200605 [Pseudocercospora fijiensis CIRAD86]EME77296.1 hypothetical protein MYCFIDRAFT_200605 [Pseudocercospora fijiensis CIRAD86]
MRFFSVVLLSTLLTLVNCQADKIIAALNSTQAAVQTLDTMVAAFNGDLLEAVKILQQAYVIGKQVENTTEIVEASPTLTDDTSLKVATSVLGLVPVVESLLKKIQAKKPAFQSIVIGLFDVTGLVTTTLTKQKTSTLALGHSIVTKLTGAFKTAAPAIIDQLEADFDRVIADYGSS